MKQAANNSSLVSLEMVSSEEVPFDSKDVYRALRALVGDKCAQVRKYGAEVRARTLKFLRGLCSSDGYLV